LSGRGKRNLFKERSGGEEGREGAARERRKEGKRSNAEEKGITY
jgi:hypothetical protein